MVSISISVSRKEGRRYTEESRLFVFHIVKREMQQASDSLSLSLSLSVLKLWRWNKFVYKCRLVMICLQKSQLFLMNSLQIILSASAYINFPIFVCFLFPFLLCLSFRVCSFFLVLQMSPECSVKQAVQSIIVKIHIQKSRRNVVFMKDSNLVCLFYLFYMYQCQINSLFWHCTI